MPQRFFTIDDLRRYGLTPGDIRAGSRTPLVPWRLQDTSAKLLRALLVRTGFDVDAAIHVHESTDPPGFVFTQ